MSATRPIATVIVPTTAVLVVSLVILGYLLLVTNPTSIGPVGVTAWFMAFFTALVAVTVLLRFCWQMRKQRERERVVTNFKESLRIGLLVSFTVTVLLGLASLKSLTIRDMILFILTIVLIELYFRTRKSAAR